MRDVPGCETASGFIRHPSFVIRHSSFVLRPSSFVSMRWLADRTRLFDASGIRRVFDLGAKLKEPIN